MWINKSYYSISYFRILNEKDINLDVNLIFDDGLYNLTSIFWYNKRDISSCWKNIYFICG